MKHTSYYLLIFLSIYSLHVQASHKTKASYIPVELTEQQRIAQKQEEIRIINESLKNRSRRLDSEYADFLIKYSPAEVKELLQHFEAMEARNNEKDRKRFLDRTLLLTGPTGSDRADLAKAIAQHMKARVLQIESYVFSACEPYLECFARAAKKRNEQLIIILNNMDHLLENNEHAQYPLCSFIDRCACNNIFLICTTYDMANFPPRVTSRLNRQHVAITYPSQEARVEAFNIFFKDAPESKMINEKFILSLAKKTKNFSYEHLAALSRWVEDFLDEPAEAFDECVARQVEAFDNDIKAFNNARHGKRENWQQRFCRNHPAVMPFVGALGNSLAMYNIGYAAAERTNVKRKKKKWKKTKNQQSPRTSNKLP